MLISHKHKFAFVHVPKTAGNSITEMLRPLSVVGGVDNDMKHADAATVERMVGEAWCDYYTFAFVRNPWDWLVSHYTYSVEWSHKEIPDHLCKWRESVHKVASMTFEEYVRSRGPRMNPIRHWKLNRVLRLFRYEELDSACKEISDVLGINPHLPKTNVTENRRPYREYYTESLADIVQSKFTHFIRIMRYKF